ncbi:DUF3068 domain-containing protein [Rhodococcus sp. HNM0569]|uniref:DUF3068 domain-containing protein n=1 Tax=Rhodococcus sp. HNM0569 TaxID=2716340 RepID=UPI001469E6F8|nr:DUF3068 domain-containing protein [Rhodococcus sp. HNM0569]NLU83697.1 DUF3068 domain-containing protein [Rhodococcus sp. HNM0569]
MAERSGPSRVIALILVGLGVFLLAVAILVPVYSKGKLAKTPLDLEVTTIAEGTGKVLDAKSLTDQEPGPKVDEDVPIIAQRYVTTEDPSNADDITVQAGQTVRRTDKQGDTGLLTASVDRVTMDRKSSMPTNDPVGTVQTSADAPALEVERDGLQYKFPFDSKQETYPYWDLNARESSPIDFVEETEINGLKVYHYSQEVGPFDLSKADPSAPTNKLQLPASAWGVEGGELPITMTRWYTNTRDLWVEPETGVVVKGQEQIHQYYARNKARPEIDVLDVSLPFNEETIEFQAQQARDGIDQLNTFARTLPIVAGIVGVIALIGGVVLGLRSGRGRDGEPVPAGGPVPPNGGDDTAAAPTEQFGRSDYADRNYGSADSDAETTEIPRDWNGASDSETTQQIPRTDPDRDR